VKLFSTCLPALVLFAGLSGFPGAQLHGQGVTVEVSTLPRVGVSISGPLGGGVTEIVSNDLKRTGMISPVGSGSGDYLATGEASESGVIGQLLNKKSACRDSRRASWPLSPDRSGRRSFSWPTWTGSTRARSRMTARSAPALP
jgi:hypothetical protein